MKKFLICLLGVFICLLAHAATETINWFVDGNTYATTTCQTGGDITLPTTPTKYGYTFQGWAGYVFLEYIISTGTQYINTGYVFNINDGVLDIEFTKISTNNTNTQGWGSYSESTNQRCLGVWFNLSSHYVQLGNNNLSFPTEISVGDKHHLIVTAYNGLANVELDGTEVINTTYTGTIVSGLPLYLFAMNNRGVTYLPASLQVYKAKLYENSVLVRDFIPAKRASDNAIGMYDTVSNTFFENAGTGEFIAGPIVNQ